MFHLSIHRQCELLDLPRSCYYYEPVPETAVNLALMRQLDELHLDHPYYGVRRMQTELSTDDVPVNIKRIRRLMHLMGMETLYRRPNLSKPRPNSILYPYLLRGLAIIRPNQVWSTDITYIPMRKGFMYLCAIIDWYSRYILSWKLSNTLTAEFCIETLEEAVSAYGKPEIVNTDQGSQFSSEAYTEWLKKGGIRQSMDGKGRATDNVAIERFWRSLKYEKIYLYSYSSNLELFMGITEYIHFYNHDRTHQRFKKRTPASIYFGKKEQKEAVPETALST